MVVQTDVPATTTFGLGIGIWLFGPAGPGYTPATYTECVVFIIKKTTQTAAKSIEILSYSWFGFSNLSLSGDPIKLQFTTTLSGHVGFRRLL